MCAPQFSPSYPQRHRHQRGPGLLRQRGRAAHDPGGLAEELDLDSAAGQVPFAQQGDQAASPQPLRQDPEPARAGRVRQHLHAQPLPERHEPVMQRFRAQPLRHRGDLSGAAEHDPGARVLPVAHVRQREDHPAARRQVPERGLLLASRPHPAEDLRRRDHRQPERLQPVPQIGTHPVPRKPPEIHNRCIRANHPRQVRLQLPDTRPLPPPQLVCDLPEHPLRPPPGHPANYGPAEQVQPGAHPFSHRGHLISELAARTALSRAWPLSRA